MITSVSMAASKRRPPAQASDAVVPPQESIALGPDEALDGVHDLNFREAQTALELCLAQLQASDLEVEAMATLHRRAQAYANHCVQLLEKVEQEVQIWDPERPEQPAQPYQP
jgi:exodeoxyribonuclease VII small subunit